MQRRRAAAIAIVAALTLDPRARVLAQAPDGGSSFDVVSIKPNTSEIGPGFRSNVVVWRPNGSVTMTNVIPANIISRAYPGYAPADMVGLPAWARTDRFDVTATSAAARVTPADRVAMLRAMLAQRFNLSAHVEQRSQPVYSLVLARGDRSLGAGLTLLDVDCTRVLEERDHAAEEALAAGTPLPQAPPGLNETPLPCTLRSFPRAMRDRSSRPSAGNLLEGEATMSGIAASLRFELGRRVVDRTGLAGSYRVQMTYAANSGRGGPALTPDPDGSAASIFTALQEQLGLKVVAADAAVDTLVIDRIERPTDN